MDGWETRRRRSPGHDWCIVQLGLPGIIHAVVVDTAFFRGNYPTHCGLDACGLAAGADPGGAEVRWWPILDRSELTGDTRNTFPIDDRRRITHVRLNIFPDGGIARLRLLGEVLPSWTSTLAGSPEIDLAAAVHGGYPVDASDRFFGEPRNLLMPYEAANMGDGWETKRRRTPGHDWCVIRLGIEGVIKRVEVDTRHFKGNYPDSCSVEAADLHDEGAGVSADVATRAMAHWRTLVGQTKLEADHLHRFEVDPSIDGATSHVRLNIFPDGGVSRFRVFGQPVAASRRAAILRQLNAMDEPDLRAALADLNGAPAWADRVAAARPFTTPAALIAAADAAADQLTNDDWLEAFRHHPRIGGATAERPQSTASSQLSAAEQAGVGAASAAERTAIEDANRAYEQRFGYLFIVSAEGKTAADIREAQRRRLANDPATELRTAAGELRAITRRRLEKLLG